MMTDYLLITSMEFIWLIVVWMVFGLSLGFLLGRYWRQR